MHMFTNSLKEKGNKIITNISMSVDIPRADIIITCFSAIQ